MRVCLPESCNLVMTPCSDVSYNSWLSLTEGRWRWADGTEMALPTSSWHAWFEGEPDNQDGVEHCAVVTNYVYWAVRKHTLGEYVWRDFSCLFNNNKNIQGYICERKGLCIFVDASNSNFDLYCLDYRNAR